MTGRTERLSFDIHKKAIQCVFIKIFDIVSILLVLP